MARAVQKPLFPARKPQDANRFGPAQVAVRTVRFRAEGFVIAAVRGETGDFTVKGHLGDVREGQKLTVSGSWKDHPKFGRQLEVEDYQLPEASGVDELEAFLSSGFIKGVGLALAKRIVAAFGQDTATVFDQAPHRLLEVSGVGPKNLGAIVESWKQQTGRRKSIVEFQRLGIGPRSIEKLLRRWPRPGEALEQVRANPYLLIQEIDGIAFLLADRIARAMGHELYSPFRVRAAILHVLEDAAKAGHCFLPESELLPKLAECLLPSSAPSVPISPEDEVDLPALALEHAQGLIQAGLLHIEEQGALGRCFALERLHQAEVGLAEHVLRLVGAQAATKGIPPGEFPALLPSLQAQLGLTLAPEQLQALHAFGSSKVLIVTGGPGTGKTTLLRAILAMAGRMGLHGHVRLIAPTGRAAKRMAESCGLEASTVHRFLGARAGREFQVNADRPSPARLVICDESSMLDVPLACALVSALRDDCRLVLVGDADQLPSVGPGNVLRDLIGSGRVPTIRLARVFRQAAGSAIAASAQAILAGNRKGLVQDRAEFVFDSVAVTGVDGVEIPAAERAKLILDRLLWRVRELLRQGYTQADIQVLAPMHKGPVGVGALNLALQGILNPHGQVVYEGRGFSFRAGDRVLQVRNNYDKAVFNGDQGTLAGLDEATGNLLVMVDGIQVPYSPLEFADELVPAWAVSIHKSQGSEYSAVLLPVTTGHYMLLQRNMLYTAVTRAKRFCGMVGEQKALGIALRNDQVAKRWTALAC